MARSAGLVLVKDLEAVKEGMRLAAFLKSAGVDLARIKKGLKLLRMTERFVRSGGRFKRPYKRSATKKAAKKK